MWELDLGSGRGAAHRSATQVAGKVVASLVFGMFLVIGAILTVQVAGEAWRGLSTHGWQAAAATILGAEVDQQSGENPYVPAVEFEYVWHGEVRTSRVLAPGDVSEDTYAEAAERLAPYPVGAIVACRIAPDGRAVLEHGSPWMALFVLFPLLFVFAGAGGLYAVWKPRRRDARGKPIEDPISSQARGGNGARALTIFGMLFTAIGAAVAWPTALSPALSMWRAGEWAAEQCVVERSDVRSHRSDDGTTYSVDILYRWKRGGSTHHSNRYSFFGGSSSGREGKAEIVRAHPAGRPFTCWVDPLQPDQAVIERGPTVQAWIAVVPFIFVAAGLSIMRLGWRHKTRRARLVETLRLSGHGPAPDDPVLEWLPDFDVALGRQRLPPESTRGGRLCGIVFAFFFWNGIVSVFVSNAIDSFERGRPDWGLALFLVPFVLIGIGLGFAIAFELLRATNARTELLANGATLRMGETLEVEWRLQGRVSKLRRLGITLEGREEATYRRGTNSHTAMQTFTSRRVVSLVDPHRMVSGRAAIALPRDLMHSFDGGHNKISWAIHVVGEIDRWPDIDERFPIVVLPLPPGQVSKPDDAVSGIERAVCEPEDAP